MIFQILKVWIKVLEAVMTKTEEEGLFFGAVVFIKGKHKGKIGYYDDDSDSGKQAIVYLGKPFQSEYVLARFSSIKNITSLEHEKFKKENKHFCEKMGIN